MADAGADPEGIGRKAARLKRRADFLTVARGTRVHTVPFSLQARKRDAGPAVVPPGARVGLTVTKKTGNAVVRNRIRRRLRHALLHAEALSTEPDTDYVVVARREALLMPFARLVDDLDASVRRAGAQLRKPRGSERSPRRPKA